MKQTKLLHHRNLLILTILIFFLAGCDQFRGIPNAPAPPPSQDYTIRIEGNSTILKGQQARLQAVYTDTKIEEEPVVTWEILSGEEFVTLDAEGYLEGVAVGDVTIRATSNKNTLAEYSVTVYQIDISVDTEQIFVGDCAEFTATIEPATLSFSDVGLSWNIEEDKAHGGSATEIPGDSPGRYMVRGDTPGAIVVESITDDGWSESTVITLDPLFLVTYEVPEENLTLSLPLKDGGVYDLKIQWEEGGDFQVVTSADQATHTYEEAGRYTLKITSERGVDGLTFGPSAPWAYERDAPSRMYLVDVPQFGGVRFIDNEEAFAYCENLVEFSAIDTPYIEGMFSTTFAFAKKFNGDISNWDVSRATKLDYLFYSADSFNKPLNSWNTEHVQDMSYMFHSANNFNQPLDSWNLSSVINLSSMFYNAINFSQNMSEWTNWTRAEEGVTYTNFLVKTTVKESQLPPGFLNLKGDPIEGN